MFISSDSNIWFDFETIGFPDHPFLLNHIYNISNLSFHDEMRFSETVRGLVETGKLHVTSVPVPELRLASEMMERYPALSIYDAVALAIAKARGWVLLTGDGRLREAAVAETVECHGTLWIYSCLKQEGRLSAEQYVNALTNLLDAVEHKGRRLPAGEIKRMLSEAEK